MLEYAALTSSDPADLARQMTERSAQGWEILHIVSSGTTITAFARRAAIAASTASATQASTAPVAQASTPQAAQTSSWASTNTASTTASTPAATASSVGDAAAPAAWYPDPAGRFELRYWNGTAWTEHVSRNGQQSTDAPVA